jgi:hypothetical protein
MRGGVLVKRVKQSVNSSAYPDLSAGEILERLKLVPNKRGQRAFLAALWLFGNRVSEALGIAPRTKTGEYTYYRKDKRGKKVTEVHVAKYNTNETDIEDISKWISKPALAIKIDCNTEETEASITLPTFKREGRPQHTFIAILNLPEEKEAWNILKTYALKKEALEPLWTFRRTTAWYYCDKYLGIPPHKLRALRATRDATTYGLDAIDIKQKYNWSTTQMAFHYASKNPRNIIDKMKRNTLPSA